MRRMKPRDLFGSDLHPLWRRVLVSFGVAALLVVILEIAAGMRVSAVAPDVARLGFTPAFVLYALLLLAGGALVVTLVFLFAAKALPLTRRWNARPDLPAAGTLALLVIGLAAVLLAHRFLVIPLVTAGGARWIPLIGLAAGRYRLALLLLVGLEIVLALTALLYRKPPTWWQARLVANIGWCALLVWIITGPNLLRGDPLEWAEVIGGPAIPQNWLTVAPRVLESWWPALRFILAVLLLAMVLRTIKDLPETAKSFRGALGT
jgi:hypothetical protein